MEKKNNLNIVLMGVFLGLALLFGGYIVYDKLLKKEEVKECPKCEEKEYQCEKCEECTKCEACNCPVCTNNGTKISSLKEISLTSTNQTVKVGNKTIKIKVDSDRGQLFINDDSTNTSSIDKAYVTDKYIIFTGRSISNHKQIIHVIDADGIVGFNTKEYEIDNLKIIDGYLHASGFISCFDNETDCKGDSNRDLIIKFIDNTLIVTPYK